jgi:hypothetical protein
MGSKLIKIGIVEEEIDDLALAHLEIKRQRLMIDKLKKSQLILKLGGGVLIIIIVLAYFLNKNNCEKVS